jgi:hypothetical protein
MKVYFYCKICNDTQLFYVEKNSRVCSGCKTREMGRIINKKYWQSSQKTFNHYRL